MLASVEARVAGHAADGAEQDRVVRRDGREVVVGQHVAGLEVAAAPSENVRLLEGDVVAEAATRRAPSRLGDDLGADAVAGDDGESDGARHSAPAWDRCGNDTCKITCLHGAPRFVSIV